MVIKNMIQSELYGDIEKINGNDLFVTNLVVPTQSLQYADGATSQGWSTLYDLRMLNANLLVKGTVTA